MQSFPFFLRFVISKNEVGKNKFRIEGLPVDERPFLLECARAFEEDDTLWIAKSRRMFLTWLCSAELVWLALRPHGHMFVQQTKEDDSDWLVEHRCKFIWDHLPEWLRFYAMRGRGLEANYKYCKLEFPNKSQIWGIAQGGEQFRKYTATGIFSDEVAIQDDFRNAHTAISALAEDGCKVRFVSSARGGTHFARVVNGRKVPESLSTPMRGIQRWELETGGRVLRVHYTADPTKDPERDGAQFVSRYSKKFDGGTDGSDWKQEMEIDFLAKSGTRIYENWDASKHIVAPLSAEFLENHPGPYWRAMDYGKRNPTVCLWFTEYDGQYILFREFHMPAGKDIEIVKKAIHSLSAESEYKFTVIDPRADRSDIPGNVSTPFTLLNTGEYSVNAMKANSSGAGIDLTRQWLFSGRFVVTSDCPYFIEEIEAYEYEDWSEATGKKHNPKETPLKKNDHCMNAWKYFANAVQYRDATKPADEKVIPIRPRYQEIARMNDRRFIGRRAVMRGYR